MPGLFRVIYDPEMPQRDGTPFRWFQVVFAVGPGDAGNLRSQVHALFPRTLTTLSQAPLAADAQVISLRARRFCPDTKILDPAHPVMFIEVEWASSALRAMHQRNDYSTWSGECLTYRNHFDRADPLTRQYTRQLMT
ncbi:MAG: hypothetical protein EB034_19195 [Verrucomicrobia bacterium]|nr:hypothetical protein [Verrucomicrobiota bacterium]